MGRLAALLLAQIASASQPNQCSLFVATDSDASRAVRRVLDAEYAHVVACDGADFERDECYAPLAWRRAASAAVVGDAAYGVQDVWPYDACDAFVVFDGAPPDLDVASARRRPPTPPKAQAPPREKPPKAQAPPRPLPPRPARRRGGRELRSAANLAMERFACVASDDLGASCGCFDAALPLPSGRPWCEALGVERTGGAYQKSSALERAGGAYQKSSALERAGGARRTLRKRRPLAPPSLAADSAPCPAAPHPGGYLWLHTWGYAPTEPIQGEGLNGWRVTLGRVLALARRTNASIVLPCARHSVLVPCGVSGPLRASDPLPNAGDDDGIEAEVRAGVTDELRAWLALGRTEGAALSGDDDASRGVPDVAVHDAGWYLDADAVGTYLGAAPITVACATRLALDHDYGYAFVASSSSAADIADALAGPRPLKIARFGGGFNLASLRDAVTRDDEAAVEAGPLRAFARRLHDAADAYKRTLGSPYTVLHWRSETMVARRDAKVDGAFRACASELLGAAPATGAALLVTDMPSDFDMPLWTSFSKKLDKSYHTTRRNIVDFLAAARARGLRKYDADYVPGDRFDLGDVAIVEQILAIDADLLLTHRAEAGGDRVANWTGVGFDVCGYAGRYMRTIVKKRLHLGRPVGNWLLDADGSVAKHASAHGARVRPKTHVPKDED